MENSVIYNDTEYSVKDFKKLIQKQWQDMQAGRPVEMNAIPKMLAELDADYSVLDPSGKTSPGAMYEKYVAVDRATSIDNARHIFSQLKQGVARNDIEHVRDLQSLSVADNDLEGWLKRANAGFAALDPTGKTSEAAAKKEYDALNAKVDAMDNIGRARGDYGYLKDYAANKLMNDDIGSKIADLEGVTLPQYHPNYDATEGRGYIRAELKAAHVGMSALDPRGKKSDAVMAAEVDRTMQKAALQSARQMLKEGSGFMEWATGNQDDWVQGAGQNLKKVGIDADTNHDGKYSYSEVNEAVTQRLAAMQKPESKGKTGPAK